MTNSRIVSKNVLAYGAIFVAAILLLTAAVSSAVLAQTSSTGSKNAATAATTTSPNQRNLPNASPVNITGSIPLGSTISSAISSKVKTNLSDAVIIAQKAVGSNTSATLAFIRPLNGYLVYDVHVKNNSNNTSYAVIVDPGNGKVLYKQTPPSLVFGFGSGHHGMFGKGKMGPFFGGYGGSGRGFGDHGSMMTGPRQMGPMGSSVPSR
ncbi:MAG: PepSY domain-containing protein [Nitrososphaeraceae archaeon]|jgi:peptidase YpeB-like protein